jgi:hypothetical protein
MNRAAHHLKESQSRYRWSNSSSLVVAAEQGLGELILEPRIGSATCNSCFRVASLWRPGGGRCCSWCRLQHLRTSRRCRRTHLPSFPSVDVEMIGWKGRRAPVVIRFRCLQIRRMPLVKDARRMMTRSGLGLVKQKICLRFVSGIALAGRM